VPRGVAVFSGLGATLAWLVALGVATDGTADGIEALGRGVALHAAAARSVPAISPVISDRDKGFPRGECVFVSQTMMSGVVFRNSPIVRTSVGTTAESQTQASRPRAPVRLA
jgi:hypothetical protein